MLIYSHSLCSFFFAYIEIIVLRHVIAFKFFTSRMMNQECTYREGIRLVNQFWMP